MIKKITAGFLGIFMIVGVVGPVGARAQATTTQAELQTQITSLLNLITQLQAQLAKLGGSASTPTGVVVYTTNLTVGSTGNQVVELQKFLVNRGYLVMPAGVAFGYFGPLTQAALARFQAAQGISPAVGYFGPITRARVNALAVTVPPPTTPGTGTSTPGGISTPGVEGSMSVTQSNAGIRSTIREGEEMVPILGMRVQARTSDIAVQRVRINLGNSSTLYNKILERLYVTDGTNVLASKDLNSSTVVRDGSTYFIDLTGFNYVVPRNTNRDIVIKADVRSTVDSGDQDVSRTISLANNGVRGIDGAGIDHYSPSTGSDVARSFTVSESLAESAGLRLSINTNTPKTQDVVASSGSNDNEYDRLNLLAFDVRPERDDVRITDLVVNIEKTGSGSATASSSVYLYDGTTEIDSTSLIGNTATFSNIDLDIPSGSTKTLSIRVDIRNANAQRATFRAIASSTGITAENSIGDSIASGDKSGSATGNTIGVRNVGPEITLVSKTINTSGVPQGSGSNNMSTSTLTAGFTVRIRAVGDDIILGLPGSTTPAFSGSDSFTIYRNGASDNSVSSAATSTSYSTPSGATTAGLTNSFMIPEGSEVTIPVTFQILGRNTAGAALSNGLYSVGLEEFNWVAGGTTGSTSFMAGELEWRTNDVSFP